MADATRIIDVSINEYMMSLVGKNLKRMSFAIDTSGGMPPVDPVINSFMKNTLWHNDCIVDMIQFDREASLMCRYNTSDKIIPTVSYSGSGGTLFAPVWNFLVKEKIEPDILFVISDGFAADNLEDSEMFWYMKNYCDTVWVVMGPEQYFNSVVTFMPDFGKYIRY